MKTARAFSLTELMLSLLLGSLILLTLTSYYLAQKQALQTQHTIVTEQEQARLAILLLREAIEKSVFFGCLKLPASSLLSVPLQKNTVVISPNTVLQIDTTAPPSLRSRAAPQSDVLQVIYADPEVDQLLAAMSWAKELLVTQQKRYKPGQAVVISDCINIQIATVANVRRLSNPARQQIVLSIPLPNLMKLDTQFSVLIRDRYFIAKTKRKNTKGQPIFALYVEHLSGQREELVPHIRKMKLRRQQQQIEISIQVQVENQASSKIWKSYAQRRN